MSNMMQPWDEPVTDDEDDLLFADEEEVNEPEVGAFALKPWTLLVVDDDPEVHSMTRLVLDGVSYKGRQMRLISAYSAADAREKLAEHDDIAVILLDVVMETDDAGLRLVPYIRDVLGNDRVRIILRTGQPGQAPEREVIVNYDINDYKAKTELTSTKLFTTTIAALRGYEDIIALETSRRGLELIVDAAGELYQERSLNRFATGVLTQLCAVLNVPEDGIIVARQRSSQIEILVGAGRYGGVIQGADQGASIPGPLAQAFEEKANQFGDSYMALHLGEDEDKQLAVFVHTNRIADDLDRQLLELFCSKIAIAFDNLTLYESLRNAHHATVVIMAELAEFKDRDTGDHVRRVCDLTDKLARQIHADGVFPGHIDSQFIEQIGLASILHDVGKITTPEEILQKPGRLTDNERAIMMDHAPAGGGILRTAQAKVDNESYLFLGAEIAQSHHERWDGRGYPDGLAGEDIPLSARIVAVVDVFDALTSKRPYKDPWPREKAIQYIRDGAGAQFDPRVVDAFLRVIAVTELEAAE